MKKSVLVLAWWFLMSMGGENASITAVGPFLLKFRCQAASASINVGTIVLECFFKADSRLPKNEWDN